MVLKSLSSTLISNKANKIFNKTYSLMKMNKVTWLLTLLVKSKESENK